MRVAALGRTDILYRTIGRLREEGHEIVLIGTCQAAPEYSKNEKDFEALAEELGADFFCDSKINSPEVIQRLRHVEIDVAVSVNWLTVIGPEAIEACGRGIFNSHAGDLPRYRGNACPNWAILQGEKEVGLVVHLMEAGRLDSGPIFSRQAIPLSGDTTIGEVYQQLTERVPEMFSEALGRIGDSSFKPEVQPTDPALSLRCYPRHPQDSRLDWEESAHSLCAVVRASSEPFAGAYTYLDGKRLGVWKARVEKFAEPSLAVPGQVVWRDKTSGEVGVAAGEDLLVLQEVGWRGVRQAPAQVLRSLRTRLGLPLEETLEVLSDRISRLERLLETKLDPARPQGDLDATV